MCVFKYHAFIYFLRPPPWYGTGMTTNIRQSRSYMYFSWTDIKRLGWHSSAASHIHHMWHDLHDTVNFSKMWHPSNNWLLHFLLQTAVALPSRRQQCPCSPHSAILEDHHGFLRVSLVTVLASSPRLACPCNVRPCPASALFIFPNFSHTSFINLSIQMKKKEVTASWNKVPIMNQTSRFRILGTCLWWISSRTARGLVRSLAIPSAAETKE
jgi:hypothetical protein